MMIVYANVLSELIKPQPDPVVMQGMNAQRAPDYRLIACSTRVRWSPPKPACTPNVEVDRA